MRTPEGKPVIGQLDGSSLGAVVGPHGVVLGLPLAVSHRERLAAIREFGDPLGEQTPGANVEPELSNVDVGAWMATKGLRAAMFGKAKKRPGESRTPKHLRDVGLEPGAEPATQEVGVYNEETKTWIIQTVKAGLPTKKVEKFDKAADEDVTHNVVLGLTERAVRYAKYAGARPSKKELREAENRLRKHNRTGSPQND